MPQQPSTSTPSLALASQKKLTRRGYLQLAGRSGIGLMGLTSGLPTIAAGSNSASNHLHPAHHLSALQFPRDHGSHNDSQIEWWYLTGYASAAERLWGFQVTFFRNRVSSTQQLQSAFAAKQLLFAHAALTDVHGQHLYHDQRIARAGMPWATASEKDTAVHISSWHLRRSIDSLSTPPGVPTATLQAPSITTYSAEIQSTHFGLTLECSTTQPLLLQGQQGLSRKSPDAQHTSFYYSQPQLAVRGHITFNGKRMPIAPHSSQTPGRAWLDHEWSDALLHPDAVGWDWIGINLFNGSALTAFRLRRSDGTSLWAGGSYRASDQAARIFEANEVTFTPLRWWKSPRTNARYPVQWQVNTPAGTWIIHARVDDQELDSSTSTGAIYWEGLSTAHGTQGGEQGMGYLEMTGYAKPLQL